MTSDNNNIIIHKFVFYYPTQMTSDEVNSGYYPSQMERCDWSDSFVYVTKQIFTIGIRLKFILFKFSIKAQCDFCTKN